MIYNYKVWFRETQPDFIRKTLESSLKKAGYTILGVLDHHFSPQGYTCMWLLAESHCAVHTFPEHNKCYMELSGCNNTMNDLFMNRIKKEFHLIDN